MTPCSTTSLMWVGPLYLFIHANCCGEGKQRSMFAVSDPETPTVTLIFVWLPYRQRDSGVNSLEGTCTEVEDDTGAVSGMFLSNSLALPKLYPGQDFIFDCMEGVRQAGESTDCTPPTIQLERPYYPTILLAFAYLTSNLDISFFILALTSKKDMYRPRGRLVVNGRKSGPRVTY